MKRTYVTLDGMRGLAALLIVMRHSQLYFGGFGDTESYLAVDLFFGLSGFVLAHAYGERLDEGLGPVRFLGLRLARLYPLYVIGLVLGLIANLAAYRTGASELSWPQIATAASFGLLMLPTPAMGRWGEIFPLNPPSWSLFFELLVNFAMALGWRNLTNRMLAVICGASAVGLIVSTYMLGKAEGGFAWSNLGVGFLRVGFSFFLGMLIYRKRSSIRFSASPWIILALEGVALMCRPAAEWRPIYDLGWIFIGFPALIALAVQREPAFGGRVFRFLGLTSYAIYALHQPTQRLVRGAVWMVFRRDVAAYAPWSGLALAAALLAGCWTLDKLYDAPVRKRLTAWVLRRDWRLA